MGLGTMVGAVFLVCLLAGAGIVITISIGDNNPDNDPIQDTDLGTSDGYDHHLTKVLMAYDLKNALKDIITQGGKIQDMESGTNGTWYVYWYKEASS